MMHSTTKESIFLSVVKILLEKCLLRSLVTTMIETMTSKNPVVSVATITMVLFSDGCLLLSSPFEDSVIAFKISMGHPILLSQALAEQLHWF